MRAEPRIKTSHRSGTFFQKMENLNPHHLFLYMSVLGSAIIFLFLLVTFNLSYDPKLKIEFPTAIFFSTGALILSNIMIRRVIHHYHSENMHQMVVFLGFTMMLSISFLLAQFIVWEQLYNQELRISGQAFGSYAYLISGLHALHLTIAIFFLSTVFYTYVKATVDPVKALLLTTNPYQLVKLRMLVTCWNFLDIVWVAIAINFYMIF